MISESDSVQLDLAGLRDENGNLGGRVPANYVIVPEVIELKSKTQYWKEETLVWEFASGDPKTRPRVVLPAQETLNDFLRLAEAPSDAFLRFARKWGVLNLSAPSGRLGIIRPCTLSENGEEPISAWRYFSNRAAAILVVVSYLKQGKAAPAEQWNQFRLPEEYFSQVSPERSHLEQFESLVKYGLSGHHFTPPPDRFRREGPAAYRAEYRRRERQIVASELNAWLALNNEHSNLRRKPDFQVQWNSDKDGWELRIDYDGFLFRALAWQLALAACGARALYSCSGCGAPYIRTRHAPRRSKANFCEQCGRAVINRQAAQRRRQKISKALRLHSKGVPVPEIAKRLDTTPQHVKNWIKKKTSK